jgi:hypothetical protein
MKSQPNFERIKTLFYQAYYKNDKALVCLMLESLNGKLMPSFHVRWEQFKKDFNTWLDRLDIRQAGVLIDVMNENNIPLPSWIKHKRYCIDYNSQGFLDLIKNETPE